MTTKVHEQFGSDLPIPANVQAVVRERLAAAGRGFPPTHPHCGDNSERAGRGDPGHCEACAVVGHVVAHPDYGCGDVRCNVDH